MANLFQYMRNVAPQCGKWRGESGRADFAPDLAAIRHMSTVLSHFNKAVELVNGSRSTWNIG
jgi:hypothetical protein